MTKPVEEAAYAEILRGVGDPDYTPRYRVPARRWWQFWKPKWRWVTGISQNQVRRAFGVTNPPA